MTKAISQRTMTMQKGMQKRSTVWRRNRKGLQLRQPQVTRRSFWALRLPMRKQSGQRHHQDRTYSGSHLWDGVWSTAKTTLPAVQPSPSGPCFACGRWDTCGRTVLDLEVEPPHFPWSVCKESGNETVVHSVYTVFPWFLPTLKLTSHASTRLSWRKLSPPSNSFHMITQPHSLLATRMTWTTQIACLASLYSHTVLHCTYLVFVPNKRCQSCAFQWCTHDWSTRWTGLKLICPRFVPALLFYPVSMVWN